MRILGETEAIRILWGYPGCFGDGDGQLYALHSLPHAFYYNLIDKTIITLLILLHQQLPFLLGNLLRIKGLPSYLSMS
jgi:hypothetical protein